MTPTVADALALGLRRHEVGTIFGQSLPSPLLLASEKLGIRQLEYRTENAGGAMADGFARISHRIGVVAAQNGPAATLLVPPLAEATKVSIPILALVQDVPVGNRDRNAFQEFDHFGLFASCSKWTRRLEDPARADDYLDMAIIAATTGRPGPAVLLLPRDVLLAPAVPQSARRASLGQFPLDRCRPDPGAVVQAAQLLAGARAPVVVAGGGVHHAGAAAALGELQALAGVPVATTNMGKGAVDETNPLSIGVVGNYMGIRGATRAMRSMIDEADVVLLVGTRTNENGTDGWELLPRDATIIHLDVDGTEIGRNYEAVRLVGDARLALEDLIAGLKSLGVSLPHSRRREVEETIARGRRAHAEEARSVTESDQSPIRPERVMSELDRLLVDQAIVVADASYSTIWVGNYLSARCSGQRFLTPRGLAGLGWGLPMALGAQVACPDAPVVCVTGDGAFGHVWSELETAVRERLPVTVIVLNNGTLAFQKHAELVGLGQHTTAVDFGGVDHTAIAGACGMDAVRVERPDDLSTALGWALGTDHPTLIEVMTDPDAYPPITAWDDRAEGAIARAAPVMLGA